MRGGFALFSLPFYIDAVNQVGFSQSTLLVPTLDAGLTVNANLANPFPAGVLEPPGASWACDVARSGGEHGPDRAPEHPRPALCRQPAARAAGPRGGGSRVRAQRELDVRVANVELNPVP